MNVSTEDRTAITEYEANRRRSRDVDEATLETAADWRAYAALLLSEAELCSLQLRDRSRWREDGYLKWRAACEYARQGYLEGYRRAKARAGLVAQIEHEAAARERHAARVARLEALTGVQSDDAQGLLRALVHAAHRWIDAEGLDPTEGERALLRQAHDLSVKRREVPA